jgi:hypothetical protein
VFGCYIGKGSEVLTRLCRKAYRDNLARSAIAGTRRNKTWRGAGGVRRWPKQCIHMQVNVKMIRIKERVGEE